MEINFRTRNLTLFDLCLVCFFLWFYVLRESGYYIRLLNLNSTKFGLVSLCLK